MTCANILFIKAYIPLCNRVQVAPTLHTTLTNIARGKHHPIRSAFSRIFPKKDLFYGRPDIAFLFIPLRNLLRANTFTLLYYYTL